MNPELKTSHNGTMADLKSLYRSKIDERMQKIYDRFYAFCIDNINKHENKSYLLIVKPGISDLGLCYHNLTMRIDDDEPDLLHKQIQAYFGDRGMTGVLCTHRSNKTGHMFVPTFYTIFFSFD